MTGEITLRGEVLPIGGLKEKLLAAVRGIRIALIPEENVKDLAEIPGNIKDALEIIPVRWIDQVLKLALEREPVPCPKNPRLRPRWRREQRRYRFAEPDRALKRWCIAKAGL